MTTKEQERKALAQIQKIVDGLGKDSYIATAFEGCFEDAENNINDDAAYSMKSRWEDEKETSDNLRVIIDDLQDKLAESEKDYEAAHAAAHEIAAEKDAEIAALRTELETVRKQILSKDDLFDISNLLTEKTVDIGKEVREAADRIVELAGEPNSALFKNAVMDHRTAKEDLNYHTALLTRVNSLRKAE